MSPLLSVNNLVVEFDTPAGPLRAVDGVSLDVAAGDTLGIVGESGCGKSVTAMSILRLIPNPPGRIVSGSITFDGKDIATLPIKELRRLRGAAVGMVFQDPMTSLSPLRKIGDQMVEAVQLHHDVSRREALTLAEHWLERCEIRDPARVLGEYPFRLSGGQQQRVMIASVLMNAPKLIIADEPTTALDATIQAQVLDLMRRAKGDDTALILITHNMGVVWRVCPSVAVMYAGEIVEQGATAEVMRSPKHPYTKALLDAIPSTRAPGERLAAIPGAVPSPLAFPPGCRFAERCAFSKAKCGETHPPLESGVRCFLADEERGTWDGQPSPDVPRPASVPCSPSLVTCPLLSASHIHKRFKRVHAVNDISFELFPGETLAIVGESGCGKTTLARILAGLEIPDGGMITFAGETLATRRNFAQRRAVQMVFQDPFASLNPRMRIGRAITEGAVAHGIIKRAERAAAERTLLESVGLPAEAANRYPHEFSGGQRQRVAIARAIAMKPTVLLCDEPVSALDVSVQAQVLNLLADLKRDTGISSVFITHDLGVVRYVADRVAVMREGRIIETGPTAEIFANPQHEHTKTLLAAEPTIGEREEA